MAAARDPLHQAFGRVLSDLRRQQGLTQEELAERAGVHWTYVSQLERGIKSPSLATIAALAESLKLPPHELLRAAEEAIE